MAHRDIKPANLVVSGGHLHLVDMSFAELRASAWRRAVDLGNMFLCMALYAPVELVYAIACRTFAPADVAEGLAATRSVTIPSQLRALMAENDRSLPARAAALAGAGPPIRIQRWSTGRVALTTAVAACAAGAALLLAYNLDTAGLL
jgi:hypothetical protein